MPPDFSASDLAAMIAAIRRNIDSEMAAQGGADNLTPAQQQAIAVGQTQQAFEQAGITDSQLNQDTEARIGEYMELGVSPRTAASAAASSVVSPATPSAGEFAVEGDVIKEVDEASVYHFNDTEDLHVVGSVIHNHVGPLLYDVSGYDVDINCDTITTSSTVEWARTHWGTAVGVYPGSYKATVGASFSGYGAVTKWGGTALLFSAATGALNALRTQFTAIEVEGIGFSRSKAKNAVDATLISVTIANVLKEDSSYWSIK